MLIFFIFIIGLTIYLYSIKRLDAPISPGIRTLLTICRLLFLIALMVLFFRPMVLQTQRFTQAPSLYIALDDSQSMSFPIDPKTNGLSRWKTTIQTLKEGGLLSYWKANGFPARYGLFSACAMAARNESPWRAALPESATPAFTRTDLATVIRAFQIARKRDESAYLLLFTDGQWNHGENPLTAAGDRIGAGDSEFGLVDERIFTFGIGTLERIFDLYIESIEMPAFIRAGDPLELVLHAAAGGDVMPEEVTIQLRGGPDEGTETFYQERKIQFTETERETALSFSIPYLAEGNYKFTAEITPLNGELFTHNNTITRGVRVLKEKDRILLLCGAPNWGLKFLKRVFEDRKSFDLQSYLVMKDRVSLLGDRTWVRERMEEPSPERYDVEPAKTLDEIQERMKDFSAVILYNYSFAETPVSFTQELRSYIEDGGGVLFIPGSQNRKAPSLDLRGVLPAPLAQTFNMIPRPVLAQPDGSSSAAIREALKMIPRDELPPLDSFSLARTRASGGQVLLEGVETNSRNVDLVILRRFGLGRIVSMLSPSFWRWYLLTGRDILTPFWLGLVYECQPRLHAEPGKLYTDGFLYDAFTPVLVTYVSPGEIQDASMVGKTVYVNGPERNERLWLEMDEGEPGVFKAKYTPVNPGDYRITTEIKDATADFRVVTTAKETHNLSQNINDLRQIAELAGGEYANQPAWKHLAEKIPKSTEIFEEQTQLFLGEKWWYVLALILFLCVEWYIRWRQGLP